jgi:hypothetical protein
VSRVLECTVERCPVPGSLTRTLGQSVDIPYFGGFSSFVDSVPKYKNLQGTEGSAAQQGVKRQTSAWLIDTLDTRLQ